MNKLKIKTFSGKNLTKVKTTADLPTEYDRLEYLNKMKSLFSEEVLLKCSYGTFRFIKIGKEYVLVENI